MISKDDRGILLGTVTGAALALFFKTVKWKETLEKVKKSGAEIMDDTAAGLRNAEQKME